MLKTLKEKTSNKFLAGIYIFTFLVLLFGMTLISYTIAGSAFTFEVESCNLNAITYLY